MRNRQPSASLIFDWPERQPASWSLAVMILVSALLHSSAFFLFQTKDPSFKPPPQTASAVQLLTPLAPDGTRSSENEALLQWIATQDPALVANIPSVEPKGLLDIPYRPSFQTVRTHPLGVPPEPATIQFPPPHDPLALIRHAAPRAEARPPGVLSQATRVIVSAPLAARAPGDLRMIPAAKTDKPFDPTTVLASVAANGEVRFTFLQQGSGSAELDAEANASSEKLHFAPAAEPLQWGVITFVWGDDAFASSSGKQGPR